jgi:3-keto-5-aminohexanoate cleavage enzyme
LRRVLELGGHLRVGYEDSPFLSNGQRARNNVELVEDAVAQARQAGRHVAGPDRAREIIGLKPLATRATLELAAAP